MDKEYACPETAVGRRVWALLQKGTLHEIEHAILSVLERQGSYRLLMTPYSEVWWFIPGLLVSWFIPLKQEEVNG
jgi:hypothetical protein